MVLTPVTSSDRLHPVLHAAAQVPSKPSPRDTAVFRSPRDAGSEAARPGTRWMVARRGHRGTRPKCRDAAIAADIVRHTGRAINGLRPWEVGGAAGGN